MYLCGCHVLSVPDAATARILLLLLPLMLLVVGDDAGANGCRLLLLYCCRRSLITGSQMQKDGKKHLYTYISIFKIRLRVDEERRFKRIKIYQNPISTYIFHFHYSFPFGKSVLKSGRECQCVCCGVIVDVRCTLQYS